MSKIELINITKIYGEPKRKGLLPEGKKAVDNVSMIIPDRSFTVLVGPSGCGKTTLLRMIAGLETITLGKENKRQISETEREQNAIMVTSHKNFIMKWGGRTC